MNIELLLKELQAGGDILQNVKAKAQELGVTIIDPIPEDIDIATAQEGLYDDTLLYSGQPYNLTIKENSDTQYGTDALIETLTRDVNYVDHAVEIKESDNAFKKERRFETIEEVELDEFLKSLI